MALKSRSDIVMPLMKTKGENVLYGLGDSRATGNLDLVVPMRGEENDYCWAQTLGQASSFTKVEAFNPLAILSQVETIIPILKKQKTVATTSLKLREVEELA